ncbi:CPBP family intramembrane metalloprotease [Aeromicrobium sp. 636]|uniref:CPBP family intramembrane metalloprotease n=1 Tax=Aeromicrobium senzhongii TaxID=2663859 RepID=A0A8I0K141_9ACTN|nr:type II CAAX endopeptidase family protein [Aeromicrobium sp. 636]MBC9227031.1 CPBP family intramembrane metalloprotease [Aeromicrobium senzhongii]MCQ3999131.1 CPBP family intramembrane metalloprotease [Aeromicrobium sp. 636]
MTPYHRLARESPDFAHWRLPVAAVLGIVFYGSISVGLTIVLMIVLVASGADTDAWLGSASTDIAIDDPGMLLFQLGTIAALIPCVLVPVALVWRRHVGYLHSVAGHLRWRWLGRCVALGFLVVGVTLGLSVVVAAVVGDDSVQFASLDGRAVASLLVVLLVVPFQASAEEYVFRGALMQLIGSWTRWAVVPVVATSLLFAAGHVYDFWGLVSVFLFGVIAAVMTIRTGGLEAAIGLHIANNTVLMVLDVLGLVDSSGEGAGFLNEVVPSTVMCLVFWALVEWSARRHDLQRLRPSLPPLPAPVPAYRVVPPPPYVPPGVPPQAVAPPAPVVPVAPPRAEVPPNAPSYPGDPGVWDR